VVVSRDVVEALARCRIRPEMDPWVPGGSPIRKKMASLPPKFAAGTPRVPQLVPNLGD
jgi:hypothetical protein